MQEARYLNYRARAYRGHARCMREVFHYSPSSFIFSIKIRAISKNDKADAACRNSNNS